MFTFTVNKDGTLITDYKFTMKEAVAPRQIGLVFHAPNAFSQLSWQRKGYWNYYPAHHIGALEGSAMAFDKTLPISGLAGPSQMPQKEWGNDQTQNGSNLFRSTKENIYQVKLTDSEGHTIHIQSDGTQHFRSWIDQQQTVFLVADYTNAGSDTYFSSHAALEYKPLQKGDKITGTIRLAFEQ